MSRQHPTDRSTAVTDPGHATLRHRHERWVGRRCACGPLRRSADSRMLGGVAAGVARRIGRDVTIVRAAFVVAGLFGFGVVPYLIGWLLIPADGEPDTIGARALHDRGGLALATALASVAVLIIAPASLLGLGWISSFGWSAAAAGAVLVLVARDGSPPERETLRRLAGPLFPLGSAESMLWSALRIGGGILLLLGGIGLLLRQHVSESASTALRPLGGLSLVVLGIVVLLVPWWWRVARDLVAERQARARAEERADIAARLHDSVLQTLALIQRRAGDPQQVVQLARAQERELRGWLFGGAAPGGFDGDVATVAAGVQRLTTEVEETHGIRVEAVVVGDAPLDEPLTALLEAVREAAVNAAKWSGAPDVSVFVEVDGDRVAAYVRDRGRGFDPARVPADRKGLSESVVGRMSRHGGSAQIRSAVGEGTEVVLRMPRTARDREHAARR